MKKTKVKMNKPVYLDMSVLDISKTLMYELWYDYIKPKYGDKAELYYMDTDSFIIHIITEEFYKDIANDVEIWFDTSNFDENKTGKRPLPIGKNKKVIGLFKMELRGKIMGEFCALRAKTYAYIMADGSEKKKAMFGNYTDCLFTDKIILKSQQRFKSYNHDVYTEEVNKIALSSNDDKRLQTFDRITTYPYGTNAFKVCESEMMKSYYNHNKDLKVYIEQVCNDMIKYK